MMTTNRRGFLRMGAMTAASASICRFAGAKGVEKPLFSAIGMSGRLDQAAALKAAGVEFITASTVDLLVPDKPESVFAPLLEQALACPLPVLACNGFIRSAHLKCVGPQANHDQVLEWAGSAFERLARVKAKFMVFGSGGARRIQEGWTEDKADEQFIALLRRMGPLAEKAGVTVVVEQLQVSECNFINRIGHGAKLIRAAGHPRIRLLADLFHMARGGDTPEELAEAMDVVAHVEIAEKADRTYPGIRGDDFRPYFRALRASGYSGSVSIEGKGKEGQIAAAIEEIRRQAKES